jgi:hypothetical protein
MPASGFHVASEGVWPQTGHKFSGIKREYNQLGRGIPDGFESRPPRHKLLILLGFSRFGETRALHVKCLDFPGVFAPMSTP